MALSLYTLVLLKKHLNGSDKYLPPIKFYWSVNFLYPKETLPMKAAFFSLLQEQLFWGFLHANTLGNTALYVGFITEMSNY